MSTFRSIVTLVIGCAILSGGSGAFAQGIPGVEPNKCLAGKNKCVSKLAASLLKCRELCQKKPDKKCGEAQVACEQKAMDKFDGGENPDKGCFEKLEAKGEGEGAKPDQVCTTIDDTAAMEAEIDGLVADLIATLEGNPSAGGARPCPSGCTAAIMEYARHAQSDHVQIAPLTCNPQLIYAAFEGANPSTHIDGIVLDARPSTHGPLGECRVILDGATVLADFALTDEEAKACVPLASLAVELATGQPCDTSAL